MKWGTIRASDDEAFKHPGRLVDQYIQQGGYMIRGVFNPSPPHLESYEGNRNFFKFKAKIEETGRIPGFTDPDYTKDSLTDMVCKLTGLCLDFVTKMRDIGIDTSLQMLLGTEWILYFRYHYLKCSDQKDHYDVMTDKLPVFVNLPYNSGKTIFRKKTLHRDLILKKKMSYEIKPIKLGR